MKRKEGVLNIITVKQLFIEIVGGHCTKEFDSNKSKHSTTVHLFHFLQNQNFTKGKMSLEFIQKIAIIISGK